MGHYITTIKAPAAPTSLTQEVINMFNLFKRRPKLSNYSFLGVDMHSHLLYGIDDGAKSLDQSLFLIQRLKELGFHTLITTPHVMTDLYPNTPETILPKLKEVRKAIAKKGLGIHLEAAAEYLIDETFADKFNNGELLLLPGKRVLIEMSFFSAPPTLNQLLFRLQTKGYRPLLAHPERYLFLAEDFRKYHELKERGCEFQLNLLSLSGYYGKPIKETAFQLLKDGLIDFAGTDLHHGQHARQLEAMLADSRIAKALIKAEFKNESLAAAPPVGQKIKERQHRH